MPRPIVYAAAERPSTKIAFLGSREGTRTRKASQMYGMIRELTWNQFVTMYGRKQYRSASATSAGSEKNVTLSLRRQMPTSARPMHGTSVEIWRWPKPQSHSAHML